MKIYMIATETHETYGQGDIGTELRICREDIYGKGAFPPAFETKKDAEEYLRQMESWKSCDKQIVELELRVGE